MKVKSFNGRFTLSGNYMYLIIDNEVWQWCAEGLILVCTFDAQIMTLCTTMTW